MDTYRVLSRMSKLLRSIAEFRDWIDHCNTCLQLIVEYQRSGGVSVAAKQRLVSLIARIKTLRVIVREKFSRVGCGVSARSTAPKVVWEDVESAFIGRISTGAVINVGHVDPRRFLEGARRTVISRVTDAITKHKSVAVNTNLNAEFMLGENTDMKSFGTRNRVLLMTSNVREWYSKHVVAPTLVMLEEFQDRDSGWTLRAVLNILVNINKHNPLRAGCDIPLPRDVVLKKAVVNVKSGDNACFLWSVVASLYPAATNVSRISSYPHYSEVLRTDDMTVPVTLDQLAKFERFNDVSVNVYTWSDGSCVPLRLTEDKRERHANLLLVQDPKEPQRYHFACIRSMSRLISKQLGNHNGQVFVCER